MLWGTLAAVVFLALSTPNLTAQGAYYDELFQVPSAFAYTGRNPAMFNCWTLWGMPALNLNYNGAIKSGLFGSYLKWTGAGFSLGAWRLLGISLVGLGVALFVCLSHPQLRRIGIAVFLVLFLSDGMVLLGSRHDWGPVALALGLRLAMIGVWIAGESRSSPRVSNSFLLGTIVGVSLFEKLTNVVLLPVLLLFLAGSGKRRSVAHCVAVLIGGIVGAIPLIAVNISSFLEKGILISADVPAWPQHPMSWIEHVGVILALGLGREVTEFILGLQVPFSGSPWTLLPVLLLGLVTVVDLLRFRVNRAYRMSMTLVLSYAAIVIGLKFLPRSTWMHHWIAGTPFQYAAVALTFSAMRSRGAPDGTRSLLDVSIAGLILALAGAQLVNLAAVETALWRGVSSPFWDPSLSEIGRFAAQRINDAHFVATDWGVGTQIVSFTDGRPGLVEEIFWDYPGPERLRAIAERNVGRDVYLVGKRHPINDAVSRDAPERIQKDASTLSCWVELPADPAVATLAEVEVRRFRVRPEGVGARSENSSSCAPSGTAAAS